MSIAAVLAVVASVLAVGVANAQSGDTGCWEEYQVRRVTLRGEQRTKIDKSALQVVAQRGVNVEDCTPAGTDCFFGYHARTGRAHRVFVPFGLDPSETCFPTVVEAPTETTEPPASTVAPSTTETTTTTEVPVSSEAPPASPVPVSSEVPVTTTTTEPTATTTTEPTATTTTEPTATTTTEPTTTTTTEPPTTEPPSATVGFVENFDGNTGLERFRTGVFHRDEHLVGTTSWQGDHDLDCGAPGTTRTIDRNNPDDSFYLCRDHLMTSVGDTSGYSVGYFSPKTTFINETTVSWDVNVTYLLARQWWEVAVLPLDSPDEVAIDWLAGTAGVAAYPANSVVVGNGPFGGDLHIHANGNSQWPAWQGVCGLDPEGCESKAIRRTFTIVDNEDGTVTVSAFDRTYTVQGSFPDSGFKVVFKDHNYTPNKDGLPIGYTWHWDNISIQ